MKKFLAIVLAMLMVLSVCTACNKSGNDDGTVTLTWYVPGDKYPDTALIVEELNKITMEKIGCKIDLQFIDSGSFQERMNMNMASNSDYDLTFVGYLNTFEGAASKGGLMQLDELLKLAPGITETIPEYIRNSGVYMGKTYAIPNMQITAYALAAQSPKEYTDAFKEATGQDVATFTNSLQYEPYLEFVKANYPDVFPFQTAYGTGSFRSQDEGMDAKDPFFRTPIYGGASSYQLYKDSENKCFKIINGLKHEELSNTKARAEKLHEYYKKGWIRQDVDSVLDDTAEKKQKRYALWFGTYKPGMDGENFATYGWETVSTRVSSVSIGSASATMVGIGANCKHPEEAIKFIELMNTDKEAYNLVCFGIEGKHYKKVGDERIELFENSTYKPNASWKFGNQFNAYRLPGQPDNVWEETIEFNNLGYEMSKVNPDVTTLGFTFNKEDIKSTVTKVTEVGNKYKCKSTGSKDPDTYWDKMIAEMDAAGNQIIIDEYQKQLDAFFAEYPEKLEDIVW
ncbi:MAG: ABC transporter substrate-binding protein [Clostridia bacterium]|nr:ABC transporter substrate-binding protein [Clostridia bacterium]